MRKCYRITKSGRKLIFFESLRKGDRFILEDGPPPETRVEKGDVCNIAESDAFQKAGTWTIRCREIDGAEGELWKHAGRPVDLPLPALPKGFELNGDAEHDKEEAAWAQMEGCSPAPVGQRTSFDAWRSSVQTIRAIEGWTVFCGRFVSSQPYVKLMSPKRLQPWTDPFFGDVGTEEVRLEVLGCWEEGQLSLNGEAVDPDDLYLHASLARANQTSPAQEAWHAQLAEGRKRVRSWYQARRLGADPREAGDWLDALHSWELMPRPLTDDEKSRFRRGLTYLRNAGLLELAREHGVTIPPEAEGGPDVSVP